jgi:hypothetical protein
MVQSPGCPTAAVSTGRQAAIPSNHAVVGTSSSEASSRRTWVSWPMSASVKAPM